jgi:hypothetical protein
LKGNSGNAFSADWRSVRKARFAFMPHRALAPEERALAEIRARVWSSVGDNSPGADGRGTAEVPKSPAPPREDPRAPVGGWYPNPLKRSLDSVSGQSDAPAGDHRGDFGNSGKRGKTVGSGDLRAGSSREGPATAEKPLHPGGLPEAPAKKWWRPSR